MTQARILATLAIGAMLGATAAHAADPAAGKQQFEATCSACHGANGISVTPIYPNVAGQKDQYLVAQLKAFRDGSRPNAIMGPMAKGLSDTDITNIAAYVSTLKP
ncbi:MAG TPA: cytochrome c [Casimicrobiaceae bacterium]|nr:cytochrome c [Casimicrobiaceae bacterium]